jgi:hypothetical protein
MSRHSSRCILFSMLLAFLLPGTAKVATGAERSKAITIGTSSGRMKQGKVRDRAYEDLGRYPCGLVGDLPGWLGDSNSIHRGRW